MQEGILSAQTGAIEERVAVDPRGDMDSRETIVVAATVAAVVLAKVYWLSRIGFDNPFAPVLNTLGLSLFLVAAPLGITKAMRRDDTEWWTSQSVVALACVALVAVAGQIAEMTGNSSVVAFAITGYALAAWTVASWVRRSRALASITFIAGSAIFVVWCAGVIWGSRYKMPLFWETLEWNANIHHDTFYYGAMANMLETYGVPTTGLNGIPPIHYHFGSPWLFAKLSDLLGMDVLSFYSLGYPIIVLPFFFSALLLLSVELRAAFGAVQSPAMRADWRPWLVFLAATVGFIPTRALDALAVWNSNAFISESYLTAMSVLMLVFGTGIAFRRSLAGKASAWIFLVAFVPGMLSLLGFLKISQMLLPFAVGTYLLFRLGLYRRPVAIVSLVASGVAVVLTYRIVAYSAQNAGFSPIDFMRFNTVQGWQQFFPLFHLLWTWVYLAARVWEDGARDLRSLWVSIRAGRLIDAEALALFALLSVMPGEVISIHGGSAVYFSDSQRWLALAFILARLPLWASAWRASRAVKRNASGSGHQAGLSGIRLSTILGIVVAAPFVITLFVNLVQWPVRVARANVTLRRELISLAGGHRSLTDRTALAKGVQRSPYYPIVTALRDISRLPADERRNALLFIPQSNRQYWSMFTADGRCTFTPLIAPAVSAVALLDGMPAADCEMTNQYNMAAYRPREGPQTAAAVTDAALCAEAKAWGFGEVLILDAPNGSAPHRRRLDCYLP